MDLKGMGFAENQTHCYSFWLAVGIGAGSQAPGGPGRDTCSYSSVSPESDSKKEEKREKKEKIQRKESLTFRLCKLFLSLEAAEGRRLHVSVHSIPESENIFRICWEQARMDLKGLILQQSDVDIKAANFLIVLQMALGQDSDSNS